MGYAPARPELDTTHHRGLPVINRNQQVFILVGARVYEVTQIFCDARKANAFLALNPDQGVIAVNQAMDTPEVIFLAKLNDKGRTP